MERKVVPVARYAQCNFSCGSFATEQVRPLSGYFCRPASRPRRFARARLAQSCLPGSGPGFSATLTTIAFVAIAACSGLRPAPDCRPRRALLHLSYSSAPPCGPAALVTHGTFSPDVSGGTYGAKRVVSGHVVLLLSLSGSDPLRTQLQWRRRTAASHAPNGKSRNLRRLWRLRGRPNDTLGPCSCSLLRTPPAASPSPRSSCRHVAGAFGNAHCAP